MPVMAESTIKTSVEPRVLAVSLIICTRNRPAMLTDTVDSILRGDAIPAEIVIVDQSTEPHPFFVRPQTIDGCAIRYCRARPMGLSAARNQAIAIAQHDLIVSTDDDVLVTRSWLATLVAALTAAGEMSIVTGQVRATEPEVAGAFAPSTEVAEQPAIYAGRVGRDVLSPLNAALYRSALVRIGPFDERLGTGAHFPAAEDNDLGYRLLEAGYRIHYVPDAVLYHRAWRNGRQYLPLRWNYGRGQGAFFAKHLTRQDRYMLHRLSRLLRNHAVEFARQVTRNRHAALGHAVYSLGLIAGAVEWLLFQPKTPAPPVESLRRFGSIL